MTEPNISNNGSENTLLTNLHMLNVLYLHNLTQNLEQIDELLEETQENKLSFTQESQEISRQLENINVHLSAQNSDSNTKKQKSWEFKMCYLSDRNGLPPPKNADVDLRKSLNIVSINDISGTRWTKEEWTPMLKVLESIVIKGRSQPFMKRKEELTNDLETFKIMRQTKATKEAIEKIEGMLNEINEEIEKIIEIPVTLQDIEKLNPEVEIDWLMVAAMTGNKSAGQCKHLWTNYLKPSINKQRWSDDETQKLRALVEKHGKNAWDRVALLLDSRRTGAQCLSQYQKEINYDPKIEWTPSEDSRLIACVLEQRVGDNIPWNAIQTEFPRRTVIQLMTRFTRQLDPDLKWGRWSEKEDKLLMDAYAKYAPQWYKVARRIPGRTDVQCRDRYRNFLNPFLKFGKWSCEEDAKILKFLKLHGRVNWMKMAQELPNRFNRQIMVRCGLLLGVKTLSAIKYTLSQNLANLESELESIYKNHHTKSKGVEPVGERGESCSSKHLETPQNPEDNAGQQHSLESQNASKSDPQTQNIHNSANLNYAPVNALDNPDLTSFLSELPDLLSPAPSNEIGDTDVQITAEITRNLLENIEIARRPEVEIIEDISAEPCCSSSNRDNSTALEMSPRNRTRFDIGTLDIPVLADLLAQLREKDNQRFLTRKKAFSIKRRKLRSGRKRGRCFQQPAKFILRHGDCKILQFFKGRLFADDFDSANPHAFTATKSRKNPPQNQTTDESYVPLHMSSEKGTKRYLSWPGVPINLKYTRRHAKGYIDKYHQILAERSGAGKGLKSSATKNSDASLPYLESFLTKILWDPSVVAMPNNIRRRQNELLAVPNQVMNVKHLPPCKQNLLAWRYLLKTKPSLKTQTEYVGQAAYSSLYHAPGPVKKISAIQSFRKPAIFQSDPTGTPELGESSSVGISIDPSTRRVVVPPGSILKAAYKISVKRNIAPQSASPGQTSSPTSTEQVTGSRILSIKPYTTTSTLNSSSTVKIYPSRLSSTCKLASGPTQNAANGESTPLVNPFFRAVAQAKERQKSGSELNLIKTDMVRVPACLVDCLAAQPEVAVALPNVYPPITNRPEKSDINYPLEVARKSEEFKYLQSLVEALFLHPALLAQMPFNIIEEDNDGTPLTSNQEN